MREKRIPLLNKRKKVTKNIWGRGGGNSAKKLPKNGKIEFPFGQIAVHHPRISISDEFRSIALLAVVTRHSLSFISPESLLCRSTARATSKRQEPGKCRPMWKVESARKQPQWVEGRLDGKLWSTQGKSLLYFWQKKSLKLLTAFIIKTRKKREKYTRDMARMVCCWIYMRGTQVRKKFKRLMPARPRKIR